MPAEVALASLGDLRKSLVGDEVYHRGINSLKLPTDRQQVAKWMIDFIKVQ